ncbi:MAG: hypothetical protein JWM85_3460 [Acidimicrobiaceae bacterium]|nr:hypothetical protein [Acidimicrobiaceae bacterium]
MPSLAPTWNPTAELECLRCGARSDLAPEWHGCRSCGGPLVVSYGKVSLPFGADGLDDNIRRLGAALLPLSDPLIDLGQGSTPLVPLPQVGPRTWAKVEGQNPTGSHKDRFHAVSESIASLLGYTRVVTSSTGNHGLSCAAFAAAAGMRALVCLDPEATSAVRTQLHCYGARIAVVPGAVREIITHLTDSGWYPSTSADPALVGRGNPFGCEGYKQIAYEIVTALGHAPDVVALPVASGDTYYGIWKGFRELHERLDQQMPLILACQPVGAAPLALTEREHSESSLTVEDPVSLALSARDARSGWHATHALRSDGKVIEVAEEELISAIRTLGAAGICVEPASALAVAGLEQARRTHPLADDAEVVCVLTSSGLNWAEHLEVALGRPPVLDTAQALLVAGEVGGR